MKKQETKTKETKEPKTTKKTKEEKEMKETKTTKKSTTSKESKNTVKAEKTLTKKSKKSNKVVLFAFTGMYIGEFDIVDEGENIIINTSSKGELIFDGKTGKEITSKAKARYANRIERV